MKEKSYKVLVFLAAVCLSICCFSLKAYADSFGDFVGAVAPESSGGDGFSFGGVQEAFTNYFASESEDGGSSVVVDTYYAIKDYVFGDYSVGKAEDWINEIDNTGGIDKGYKIYEFALEFPDDPNSRLRDVVEPPMHEIIKNLDEDSNSRVAAMNFLEKIDSPGLIDTLKETALMESERDRDYSSDTYLLLADLFVVDELMERLGKAGETDFLMDIYEDSSDPLVLMSIAEGLGYTGDAEARDCLYETVTTDEHEMLREAAACSLFGFEDGYQLLSQFLLEDTHGDTLAEEAKSDVIEVFVNIVPTSDLVPLIGELLSEGGGHQENAVELIEGKARFNEQDISDDMEVLASLNSYSKSELREIAQDDDYNVLTKELAVYFLENKFKDRHPEWKSDLDDWDFVYERIGGGVRVPSAVVTMTSG